MVQIAGYIEYKPDEPELQQWAISKPFNINIQPHEGADIDPIALEVIGLSEEELYAEDRLTMQQAHKELCNIFDECVDKFDPTDKLYPIAHNAQFDITMISEFFKRNGDNYIGSYIDRTNVFCTLNACRILAWTGQIPRQKGYKLIHMCELFGIKLSEEDAHDALHDIRATYRLYNKLIQIFNT